MALDRLTGIKIGGTTYREGVTYTDTSVLEDLLGGLGGDVSVDDFEAEFDVSKTKLAIFISADAAGMGASASFDLKLVFDGKAKGMGPVAKNFRINDLGAGVYAGGLADTEVIASAETGRVSIKKAFRVLGRNPEKLLGKIDLDTLEVYAGGNFAGEIGDLLAEQGISLTTRANAVGPFGADFKSNWWTTGL